VLTVSANQRMWMKALFRHGVDIERVGYITVPGHLRVKASPLHLLAQFVLITMLPSNNWLALTS